MKVARTEPVEGLVRNPIESKHAIESASSKLKDIFELLRDKDVALFPITVKVRLLVSRDDFVAGRGTI